MDNEEELLNTLKAIQSDIATITLCILFITVLIIIELLLSMIP